MLDYQEVISPHPLKILYNLSKEEKGQLGDRITQWHGLVRIFIHPFYYMPQEIPEGQAGFQRMREMQKGLKRLLALPSSKVPPIIIFQEAEELDDLHFVGCPTENFYVIPTWVASSTPFLEGRFGPIREMEKEWHDLTKILTELGVRKILVGGMYYRVDQPFSPLETDKPRQTHMEMRKRQGVRSPNYDSNGCVGRAIEMLSAGPFEVVDLSGMSAPQSRVERWKIEHPHF